MKNNQLSAQVVDPVFNQDGKILTNSLLVAQGFGKEHRSVVRSIQNVIQSTELSVECQRAEISAGQNQSEQNCADCFQLSYYIDGRGRKQPFYIMDRDGFSLLVMGFTGQRAMKFKLDFIQAFNKMEWQLKNKAALKTRAEILLENAQLLVKQERRVDALTERVTKIELNNECIDRSKFLMLFKLAMEAFHQHSVAIREQGKRLDTIIKLLHLAQKRIS